MPTQIGYFDTLKSIAGKVFTYLASITLTGTDGKTITVTQDTSLDEAVAMSSKLAIPGAWTTPAYNAANFTANGSMTWTVDAGDVGTYAYIILGKLMIVSFRIISTTVGGTLNTQLLIAIPGSKTATKIMHNGLAYVEDNGVAKAAYTTVVNSGTTISIAKTDGAVWAASTNNTHVFGQIIFEIN